MLATANADHNVVNNTDSWLQQSLNIIQNPTSIIQSDGGEPGPDLHNHLDTADRHRR